MTKKRVVPGRTRLKASTQKEQMCLLEGVVADPKEAKKFFADPGAYASAKGVQLDSKLVKEIVAAAAIGKTEGPAAGAAGTAAVVKLPGGRALRVPGGIRATVIAASNAVVMYGATTTAAQVIALTGRARRGGGR